jgi:hypothetical protein
MTSPATHNQRPETQDPIPAFLVWCRTGMAIYSLWTPHRFAACGLTPPSPDDPAVVYAGDDYDQAMAAIEQANASWMARHSGIRKPAANPNEPDRVPLSKFDRTNVEPQLNLFGDAA